MWEISDEAATRWFAFNPVDVIDFYLKIDTDHGVYLYTDENMTQRGGGTTPFHIDSDQQLHTPSDLFFRTIAGDEIGWYSDPMAEQGPTEYASYVWFRFHDCGDCGYSATGQWNVVPEPPIYALMLVGLIGIGMARRLKAQA
ncbi:MAG: PEP-CTERM sorting domain-containing protein [Candidatus Thiodiazotropha sp.]